MKFVGRELELPSYPGDPGFPRKGSLWVNKAKKAIRFCDEDGVIHTLNILHVSDTAPADPEKVWVDTSISGASGEDGDGAGSDATYDPLTGYVSITTTTNEIFTMPTVVRGSVLHARIDGGSP